LEDPRKTIVPLLPHAVSLKKVIEF